MQLSRPLYHVLGPTINNRFHVIAGTCVDTDMYQQSYMYVYIEIRDKCTFSSKTHTCIPYSTWVRCVLLLKKTDLVYPPANARRTPEDLL